MTKQELLARFDAHQREGASLKADMEKAGVTKKDLSALSRAKAAADKAAAKVKELGGAADEAPADAE